MRQVVREAADKNSEQLKLVPEFRTRELQIESITLVLRSEIQQENLGHKLYIASLNELCK
jgi:AraC family transcriptional regulator